MPKYLKSDINKEIAWINIIIFSYMSTYYTTLKNIANWENP